MGEKAATDQVYRARFEKHFDELRWLYMELYNNGSMFDELCTVMEYYYSERHEALKKIDLKREANPDWYKSNDLLGMMFYIDNFAGNMEGVKEKLDYLEKSNVNYLHLMPFLETPEGRSDGGYAVSDFRKVQEKLGTIEDLKDLTMACHERDMCVCMDFVMNHTSEDHEWAKRARAGEGEYMARYFFYDNYDIPSQFEKTVPQVFPTTAPGNFTWLDDIKHFVMTSFYPYQWDLNYGNPRVFNEMMYNFLFLANCGIDIVRLDAVPYIWKQLGTQCRNLKEVHTIVRLMRMVSEIVCPSVILLGEVVMAPEKVVPYFGTVEKPECHMLYNVTTMATTWHTVATRDVTLLKRQLDIVNGLPKQYIFLNYLRCHDDIGWGLDYDFLKCHGSDEIAHKRYLNDYFRGYTGSSNSRGELYNDDPVTQDARFCGTTASMCGVERAAYEQNADMMDTAIREDLMLHAYMFMQSGIPVLYSGDEVGQLNDYTYKEDPHRWEDSRYLHRGKFNWDALKKIEDPNSVEGRIYNMLSQLEKIRKTEKAFVTQADTWTLDTWSREVLSIGRYYEGEKIIGVFNFSEHYETAWINENDGCYTDLLTGEKRPAEGIELEPYGFCLLKKVFWTKSEETEEAEAVSEENAQAEAPAVNDTEEAPKAEAAPAKEEAPKAEAAPAAEEAPKAEAAPAAEEAPKAEAAPAAEAAPKAEAAPAKEEAPKAEAAPAAEEAPKAEAAPAAEAAPKAEAAPAAEEAPKAAAPAAKPAPKNAPAKKPAAKKTAAKKPAAKRSSRRK